ncbi:MAG: DUF2339 domain-containing protein [Methylovulum sp.]|nr:DUF2339 domain-containing protein [Methylovulum sp.]
MNDFFGFIMFILVLVLVVMLAKLMARQTLYREEIGQALRIIVDVLREDREMLKALSQQYADAPPAPAPQPAVFEAAEPATANVLFETPSREAILESKAPAVESAGVSSMQEAAANALSEATEADETSSVPVQQAREPSRFELAARQILQEIWNWIIVGEGHRPEGMAIEYAVASNWLLRIGVLILVTGIGFFLKYSIDSGLLGEHARVALSVLAGLGMIIAGVRLAYGKYHLFSQGLLGGGIAVLYFSVFAAFSFYHLLAMYPAFALMILVTGCAAALAIRLDSILVAIFAIIGGYCTPILLSTGQADFVGLFSYMLLLGVGILAVNGYKQWHLLNFLGFFFNYLLFFGALGQFELRDFWEVMPFLIAFFVLYSTTVFLFCLVNRVKSTLLDVLALIINVSIFFITARHLVLAEYGQLQVAVVSVALAVFYIGHVYYCLARRVLDRELLLSFIGLSAFFVAITLPLLLSEQWLTVSWSLQALVMLWMAGKLPSAFLQQVAYLLYLIVLVRFCFIDLPGQYGVAMAGDVPFGTFLRGLLERVVSFGIPIASLGLAFMLVEKPASASPLACTCDNDMPPWLQNKGLLQSVLMLVAGLVFIVLQLELYHSFGYLYPPLQLPVLTLVWLAVGLLLLRRYLAEPDGLLLTGLCWFLIAVLAKLLLFDLPSWNLSLGHITVWSMRYDGAYSFPLALMRLLDFAAIISFLLFAFRRLPTDGAETGNLRSWLGGGALALLFIFLSLETNSALYQYVPGLRSGGVSILWSLFGLTFVFVGIKRRIAILRLVGLALFAVVAWKVFFIDLARLEQIYRIIAFIVLGLLALGGAFFYMRFQQSFIRTTDGKE